MMGSSEQHTSIYLVSGSAQGGKTTYLTELVGLLKQGGIKVGGFLCPGSFDSGVRSGFKLKDIRTGVILPMATDKESREWLKYRRFWFNPAAFTTGSEWIQSCLPGEREVVVIDEVGPMELEGGGWLKTLEKLRHSGVPVQLWSVREGIVSEVLRKWNIPPDHILPIETVDVNKARDMITEWLRRKTEA